jgi:hypothetical protein
MTFDRASFRFIAYGNVTMKNSCSVFEQSFERRRRKLGGAISLAPILVMPTAQSEQSD